MFDGHVSHAKNMIERLQAQAQAAGTPQPSVLGVPKAELSAWYAGLYDALVSAFGKDSPQFEQFTAVRQNADAYRHRWNREHLESTAEDAFIGGYIGYLQILVAYIVTLERVAPVPAAAAAAVTSPVKSAEAVKAEPPALIKHIAWIAENWREHWKLMTTAALVAVLLWLVPKPELWPKQDQTPPAPLNMFSATLRLRTSTTLAAPASRSFEASSGRVQLACGRQEQLSASFVAPEHARLGQVDLKLQLDPGLEELRSAPPVTDNNEVAASAIVGNPNRPGCRPRTATLVLHGTYLVDLAEEVVFRDVPVVVPYGTPQTIQLPDAGIRSVAIIGATSESPKTPVQLLIVSREVSSAHSANGKVAAEYNSMRRTLKIEVSR